jgi:hypothetical protein
MCMRAVLRFQYGSLIVRIIFEFPVSWKGAYCSLQAYPSTITRPIQTNLSFYTPLPLDPQNRLSSAVFVFQPVIFANHVPRLGLLCGRPILQLPHLIFHRLKFVLCSSRPSLSSLELHLMRIELRFEGVHLFFICGLNLCKFAINIILEAYDLALVIINMRDGRRNVTCKKDKKTTPGSIGSVSR